MHPYDGTEPILVNTFFWKASAINIAGWLDAFGEGEEYEVVKL